MYIHLTVLEILELVLIPLSRSQFLTLLTHDKMLMRIYKKKQEFNYACYLGLLNLNARLRKITKGCLLIRLP